MRLTIITPTYNRAKLLRETVDSILTQNYPDLEYIVLDDGSTDDTQAVLAEYGDRIRVETHSNMGETATVNKGFALATGEAICVVCSDDPLLPGSIQAMASALEANPDAVGAYPDWAIIGPVGEYFGTERLPHYTIEEMMVSRSWALGPGAFFRRSLLERIGFRNPRRVYCGDMEFWARAALDGPLVHVRGVYATHRSHSGSASVGQRGEKFANEWLDTWQQLFEDDRMPKKVSAQRASIMVDVYEEAAAKYCGDDAQAARVIRNRRKKLMTSELWRHRYRAIMSTDGFLGRFASRLGRLALSAALAVARMVTGLNGGTRAPAVPITWRFAICTRFTPPLWSGQAVVIGRLLALFKAESYCLVSLPLYPAGSGHDEYTPSLAGRRYLLPDERTVYRFPVPEFAQNWKRRVILLIQAWVRGVNIAKALKSDTADTIVGCSGDFLDLPAAWVASRLLRRRFVVYFFDDYTEQWWADPALRAFAADIEEFVVNAASKVLVTNEFMQREIALRYGKQSTVVRNPGPEPIVDACLPAFPADGKEVKVVFTGAVYHLNYDILRALIKALALIEDVPHRLHIYTAQDRAQLENEGLVGPHVVIHSHVTPAEAAEIQRNSDVLVIPFSFVEGAKGIIKTAATAKLADYLAAGRPILALCQADSFLAWYLESQRCGVVVSSDEAPAIAAALRRMGNDDELRKGLQRNAYRVSQGEFSSAVAGDRLAIALGLTALPHYLKGEPQVAKSSALKIAQVSAIDLVGIQVNGFLMHKWLHERGHDAKLLVNTKLSNDPDVKQLGGSLSRRANQSLAQLESKFNSTAMLPILSHGLEKDPWVKDADIVNLHLIHAAPFFSLLELPNLSKKTRLVLSVHDMFLMTGHCIYSMGCERWKVGCGACPDLGLPFPISKDTTARNWKLKNWIYDRSSIDIVVGSPWQEKRVSESPLLGRFRRHMIPYGVDTRVFKPQDKREARLKLGIPIDANVIAFRSSTHYRNFKGTEYIEKALQMFNPERETILVTLETVGGLDTLRSRYKFLELGWVVDTEKIALALQAADIFLMPSTAEAFGLMAVESMACGTPCIVFDGTALPTTIGGAACGVIVPQGDASGIARALQECLSDPQILEQYRQNGYSHVRNNHSFDDYARRYLELYQELALEKRIGV